jgi:hypothetical protein
MWQSKRPVIFEVGLPKNQRYETMLLLTEIKNGNYLSEVKTL